MGKCIKVIVTCWVLCYSTSARSYDGYNNHRFDRHDHYEPYQGHHDDRKWGDDVKWYDQSHGHEDEKWHKDGSPEKGWDFAHGHQHIDPLDNKDNSGHADCDHSSEDYGHHSQYFGHSSQNSGHQKQPFGHPQHYGQHYHHSSQNPDQPHDHNNHHSSHPPHYFDKPPKEFGQPSSEDFDHHLPSGHGSQEWNKKDEEFWGNQPRWNPYEQRWVFPDALDQYTRPITNSPPPSPWSSSPPKSTTENQVPNTLSTSTTTPLTILLCIRTCSVTPEYNPVCGSNNITYNNIGRLECAKYCGVDVTMQRGSPCALPIAPTVAASNQTTQRPTLAPVTNPPVTDTKPTRFTTIDVNPGSDPNPPPGTESPNNQFTIPPDVLASVFTNPMTDEDKAEYEIDIRTRFSDTKEKA